MGNYGKELFPITKSSGLLRALLAPRHSRLGVWGFTSVLGGSLLYVGSLAPALSSCQFWERESHLVVPPFFFFFWCPLSLGDLKVDKSIR